MPGNKTLIKIAQTKPPQITCKKIDVHMDDTTKEQVY